MTIETFCLTGKLAKELQRKLPLGRRVDVSGTGAHIKRDGIEYHHFLTFTGANLPPRVMVFRTREEMNEYLSRKTNQSSKGARSWAV